MSTVEGTTIPEADKPETKKLDHPAHTSLERVNNVTVIQMDIYDQSITKTCMSNFLFYLGTKPFLTYNKTEAGYFYNI